MKPMTVRQVFYQAVHAIVEKAESGYVKVQTESGRDASRG
jgi:hypothetical protein